MSTSYNNDSNYSVCVTAYYTNMPEIKSLSTPRLSITWRVAESYKSENPNIKETIVSHRSMRTYSDVFASISSSTNGIYMSPESRDIVSRMLAGINLPFELDRLIWRHLNATDRTARQLHNVDDMISKILEVVNGVVASGRKRVDITLEVEKEHVVPHEEYDSMSKAEKEREMAKKIADMDNRRGMYMASASDPKMAGMMSRSAVEVYRAIGEEMRANNLSEERVMDIVRSLDPESQALRQSVDQSAANIRPRPASKAAIEALEKSMSEDGDVMMCVICKEEMTACKVMPCSHKFHEDCIVRWLDGYDHRCPLCKFKLPKRKSRIKRS